jgi:hypothetical protein
VGINMKHFPTVRTVGDEFEQIEDTQAITYCNACPHPQDAHDATAVRYCAATLQLVISRRCICRGDMVDVGLQPNSAHRFP